MKGRLMVMVGAVAAAAGAMIAFPPVTLAQATAAGPGVIISVSGSATISTEGMPAGGEIWAEWYSLPPGNAVDDSGTAAKWAYVETTIRGSAIVSGDPGPMCHYLSAGGVPADRSERVADPGDVEVCNYANLPGARTENRGSEPYVFAGLAVGGPWVEGMEDSAEQYVKANGLAKAAQVNSSEFREAEKEILKSGAMTVMIRNVTLPPGGRILTKDRYPTLRMVESGQLSLGVVPEGSDPAAASKTLATFDIMEWAPAEAGKQIVLANRGSQPTQFVEWVVAPAQGAGP